MSKEIDEVYDEYTPRRAGADSGRQAQVFEPEQLNWQGGMLSRLFGDNKTGVPVAAWVILGGCAIAAVVHYIIF